MQAEDETGAPPNAQSFSGSNQLNHQDAHTRTECPAPAPHAPHKRRRTHKGRAQGAVASSDPLSCPSPSDMGATTPVTLPRRARLSTPSSTPSMSPGSGSECGGSGGSSRAGPERGSMDESWFVTPPPCFTAEGATAEASPMEDLLIEHPSMSVYVSSNNFSMVSNGNLSVVGEESVVSLASSVRWENRPLHVATSCTWPQPALSAVLGELFIKYIPPQTETWTLLNVIGDVFCLIIQSKCFGLLQNCLASYMNAHEHYSIYDLQFYLIAVIQLSFTANKIFVLC